MLGREEQHGDHRSADKGEAVKIRNEPELVITFDEEKRTDEGAIIGSEYLRG